MPIWQAVVLGVIQGLTEFLPISSTAHLLVVQQWLGRTPEQLKNDPFTVVVQLGTLFAVLWYFRADIVKMLTAFTSDIVRGYVFASTTAESRLSKYIIVGSIPAGLAGLFLKSWLKNEFYNAQSIAIVAIVFALIMAAAEWWAKRFSAQRTEINLFDAVFIGIFQALALMPGGSRSGCTISAGLFAGVARTAAARFSFLLSLPIMTAAGVKELYDWLKAAKSDPHLQATANDDIAALAVGTAVAAVVGYASIAWLLNYLRKYSMNAFVVYRIVFGVLLLILLRTGVM